MQHALLNAMIALALAVFGTLQATADSSDALHPAARTIIEFNEAVTKQDMDTAMNSTATTIRPGSSRRKNIRIVSTPPTNQKIPASNGKASAARVRHGERAASSERLIAPACDP